jgi:hypothetical protein
MRLILVCAAGLATFGIAIAAPACAGPVPEFDTGALCAKVNRVFKRAEGDPACRDEQLRFKALMAANKLSNAEMRACTKDATVRVGQDYRVLYICARWYEIEQPR